AATRRGSSPPARASSRSGPPERGFYAWQPPPRGYTRRGRPDRAGGSAAMNLPFKVCPECGVEHVHSALVCSDCQVALVLASEVGEAAPAAPLPAVSELARLAVGSPWEMERLALELQQAGISSRVDAPSPGSPAPRPLANAT